MTAGAQAGAGTERQGLSPFHRRLLIVSGLGWMFDAMDIGLVTFVLPALARDWGYARTDTFAGIGWLPINSLILSAGFLGMFVGAALAGTLADRLGRKTVFQATVIIYSVATGLSALVPGPEVLGLTGSVALLVLLRFVVGLGLGGELPVASTLVGEWAPTHLRGRMLVLLESFWAYGWIAAAAIGLLLIPGLPGGWRWAFALGALPALYVFFLRRSLPESPRYLAASGQTAAAQAALAEAGMAGTALTPAPSPAAPAAGGSIWQGVLARRTLMLWVLWFGMVFSYYGIFSWLPTLLADQQGLTTSFQYVLIITLAQVPGYFSAAWLVERWGRKPTLVTYLAGSALGALLFWLPGAGVLSLDAGATALWIIVWGSVISFFNLGAWGVIYTYTPELYPTRIRARGAGLAAAVGRLGGIIGPYVPGLWLAVAGLGGRAGLFALFAGVLLLIAGAVALLGEETRGRSLEEIAG
jgi:putative MFS transporter